MAIPPSPRGYGAAAVAGYPSLTVPMGDTQGLPLGIVFMGTAWSEPQSDRTGLRLRTDQQGTQAAAVPRNGARGDVGYGSKVIR